MFSHLRNSGVLSSGIQLLSSVTEFSRQCVDLDISAIEDENLMLSRTVGHHSIVRDVVPIPQERMPQTWSFSR